MILPIPVSLGICLFDVPIIIDDVDHHVVSSVLSIPIAPKYIGTNEMITVP
jgi:hypothetical protein